jgi:cytochrome c-type biogenesis protein CcmH/NrfF
VNAHSIRVVLGAALVLLAWLVRVDAQPAAASVEQKVDGWIGRISDSACGARHEPMEGVPEMTPKQCTLATVRGGSKFVYVLDENDKVYQIANQDHPDLVTYAGDPVALTGRVKGNVITVTKLAAPPPSPAQAQARALAGELMSPFCQGLSLATCRSEGAVALRAEIAARLRAGESRTAIVDDLAGRFGESIRSIPEPRGMGLVVWLAPFVIVAGTLAVLVRSLRHATVGHFAPEWGPRLDGAVDDLETATRLDDELRDLD